MKQSPGEIWAGLSQAMRYELCFRTDAPMPPGAVPGTVATVRALARRGLLAGPPYRPTRLGRRVARQGSRQGASGE